MTTTKAKTRVTPKRASEGVESIQLFNPNHDPHSGEFTTGGVGGDAAESEKGSRGNPHRHPLTGKYSTSTERLQSRVEEARQAYAAASDRYVAAHEAMARAARDYFTSPAHQAAHAETAREFDAARHNLFGAQRQVYSLQTDLASRRFGEGRYRFIPAGAQTTEHVAAAMREIFGRELTINELGDLASATPGDEIHVTPRLFRGAWRMEVIAASHDWREKGDITNGSRYTWRDIIKSPTSGRIRIINQYNRDATPDRQKEPGAGTRRLARQVEAAARLGVSHLETHAAGNAYWARQGKKSGFNGYYTWARLGYNARLPAAYRAKLPGGLRQASTIGGLMRTKEGRDWWKANGGDWQGKFDLKPGSYSRQTLDAYMQAKGYTLSETSEWTFADTVTALERRQPQRTESDADYQRVKRQTASRLMRSLRTYARELRASGGDGSAELVAQTAFIRRHTRLLRGGYTEGHREGLRDYWQAVSLKRPRFAPPESGQLHRRVAFYLPSVVKMARELLAAWHETRRREAARGQQSVKQFAGGDSKDSRDQVDPAEIDALMASIDWRVQLQAEVSWVGMQDGYAAAGGMDPAGVYDVIYWDLEPGVNHCFDCIIVAGGSPYTIDTLNQTPGDGRTECGAGCKCDLRMGVSRTAAPAPLASRLPSGYPIADVSSQAQAVAQQPVPRPPAETPLSEAQKQALDVFRSALAQWDRVRGALPPLDTLLAPETEAEAAAWAGISVEMLTSAQRAALDAYVQALGEWAATFSPEELTAMAQPSEWEIQRAEQVAQAQAAEADVAPRPSAWELRRQQAIGQQPGTPPAESGQTTGDEGA